MANNLTFSDLITWLVRNRFVQVWVELVADSDVLAHVPWESLDTTALSEIGLDPNVTRQVRRLANMANKAGLRGVVCSPREVAEVRQMRALLRGA